MNQAKIEFVEFMVQELRNKTDAHHFKRIERETGEVLFPEDPKHVPLDVESLKITLNYSKFDEFKRIKK